MVGNQLGVCVVGCGDMGSMHAECWNSVPGARVVAVADIRKERASRVAEVVGLNAWHADYREAIGQEEVDVVSVCVPTCLHPEVTTYAAGRGKHVLCEKPIALALEDADHMIDTARQNGVWLAVGFMRRYSPVLSALRDWLEAGELGRPVIYHSLDVRELRPKREMHDAHANGGPIIDMGVHLFDAWAYMFDSSPVAVYAQGMRLAESRPELAHIREVACDTATVVVHYASGDVGTFVVSWGLPPRVGLPNPPDQVWGPKGAAELQFAMVYQEVRALREGQDWKTVAASEENMYRREIESFARCIVEDQPPKATGEDGKAALRVALAALESLRTGRVVSLA